MVAESGFEGRMAKGEWAEMAVNGAEFVLRVTTRARREALTREGGVIRALVTAPPEEGRANAGWQRRWRRHWGWRKPGWC